MASALSASEEEETSDPRAVDAVLSELVLMLSRISLYFRFLKKHIDVGGTRVEKSAAKTNARRSLCFIFLLRRAD